MSAPEPPVAEYERRLAEERERAKAEVRDTMAPAVFLTPVAIVVLSFGLFVAHYTAAGIVICGLGMLLAAPAGWLAVITIHRRDALPWTWIAAAFIPWAILLALFTLSMPFLF